MARPFALAALASAALAAVGGAALAHHGWGSYDAGQKLAISSAGEHVAWQNPHVHVRVAHQGATWEAVLAPPFRMDGAGPEEMIRWTGRAAGADNDHVFHDLLGEAR